MLEISPLEFALVCHSLWLDVLVCLVEIVCALLDGKSVCLVAVVNFMRRVCLCSSIPKKNVLACALPDKVFLMLCVGCDFLNSLVVFRSLSDPLSLMKVRQPPSPHLL